MLARADYRPRSQPRLRPGPVPAPVPSLPLRGWGRGSALRASPPSGVPPFPTPPRFRRGRPKPRAVGSVGMRTLQALPYAAATRRPPPRASGLRPASQPRRSGSRLLRAVGLRPRRSPVPSAFAKAQPPPARPQTKPDRPLTPPRREGAPLAAGPFGLTLLHRIMPAIMRRSESGRAALGHNRVMSPSRPKRASRAGITPAAAPCAPAAPSPCAGTGSAGPASP